MKHKQMIIALMAGGLTLAPSLKAVGPPGPLLAQPPPGQAQPTPGQAQPTAQPSPPGKGGRFYGDPGKFDLSELARPSVPGSGDSGEFVRDTLRLEPAIGRENRLPVVEVGAKMPPYTPADRDLLLKVYQIIDQYAGPATGSDVQAAVQRGVVFLKGTVATATQKQVLESRITALSEVVKLIDDQLIAINDQ